ncbi:hypothetical protein [Parasitella parasitica]|uniref:ADF-H domain-containing protein n=1 Tax=Parasitella parasitica TaxID=35722 RepID=A0A0B7NQ82_9FUNG|nr:hypothetical protein [Parasitella parasitica]
MSHQSGIQVSEELSSIFSDAVSSGNVRLLRVSIENESLIPNGSTEVRGDFESGTKNSVFSKGSLRPTNFLEHVDYEQYIDQYLETSTPSYIFVRLDEKNSSGEYQWLFLCYVPDNAKVRDKMLYASTRATLTKELGDYRFSDSIYGTEKVSRIEYNAQNVNLPGFCVLQSEFTWDGYKRHLAHKTAEAPLTRREQELAEIKAAEAATVSDYQGTTTRKSYAPGVAFPLTEKAITTLSELKKPRDDREFNFVSLHLDNEKIDFDSKAQVSIDKLSQTINADAPRFTFYIYQRGSTESLVFIYTCPSSSKIKERMLYSSSKSNAVTAAANEASLVIDKKFETSDLSDLTAEYFDDELDQQSSNSGPNTGSMVSDRIQMLGGTSGGFKRPVAPGRRRPATSKAP